MASATVLVTWRHALVKQVGISAEGSIVGAKSTSQTTSIGSLKLDSHFSSRFVMELELDLLAVDLDQYSRFKAHCRQKGVN